MKGGWREAFSFLAFPRRRRFVTAQCIRRAAESARYPVFATGPAPAIVTYNYDLEFGGIEAILTDLFIAQGHQRKGLGARMMKAVCAFCQREGGGALDLQVNRSNEAAQASYRALWFEALDRIVMSFEVR